jgi:hypothetical protein
MQRPYADPMHALLATEQPGRQTRNRARGWDRLAPQIRVTEIESTHVGLITRNLPAFADHLAKILDEPSH